MQKVVGSSPSAASSDATVNLVAATPHAIVRIAGTPDSPRVTTALDGVDVRSLVVDQSNPRRLYAGTQGDGILASQDGGNSWQPAGLGGITVKALATSAAAPGVIWAGTKPPRLFRSPDAGSSWEELPAFAGMRRFWWLQPAERPHTPYVSTLAVSPTNRDVIVAGIEGFKLLRTDDGGATWTRLGRGVAFDAHEVAFHPRDAERVFLAAGFGPSTSADSGVTWTKTPGGLDRRYCSCLALDPGDPESPFVAAAPMRHAHTANARACIFRLVDGGWEKLGGGLPAELEQLPYAMATSVSEPGSVYVGLGNGTIWHSGDLGRTWALLEAALPGLRRLVITEPSR